MNKNQIIFLGAGTSAIEGAPLQKDLLREYFISCNQNLNNHNHEMDDELRKFFKLFYNINFKKDNLNEVNFPTFEEVLGILELAINRHEAFLGYSVSSILQLRDYLILSIALILEEKLRPSINSVTDHGVLVNKLKENGKLLNTSFISLNYDILIDSILIMNLCPEYDIDYGVHFTNFNRREDRKKPGIRKLVKLIKLHGSLNWLYCPTCISLTLTSIYREVFKLKWKPNDCLCPKCNSLTTPIIIPPSFLKVMSNYYLQQIWYLTENTLSKADRIIFCGYSFPDADIHIKYLLKRIEIYCGRTPEVFIVNNYENKPQCEKNNEKLRYYRLFSDKNTLVSGKSFRTGLELLKFGINYPIEFDDLSRRTRPWSKLTPFYWNCSTFFRDMNLENWKSDTMGTITPSISQAGSN